ncbi:MAG: NADH:flavin oxidoreductase [Candidatus Bipolaricaulis sp.]|nr:NADH:flavin oxidoreductase [Candidatus Bipolaricaulis sp.]
MTRPGSREAWAVFSKGRIGGLNLANRFVRSATWDPHMAAARVVDRATLDAYRALAEGGVGLIIVGDFGVVPESGTVRGAAAYDDIRVRKFSALAGVVHAANPSARVVAQVSAGFWGAGPSRVASLIDGHAPRRLLRREVRSLASRFAVAIKGARDDGFDGVQLHAAHGGLLCRFLSPRTNRRDDEYGGSPEGRCRLFREILSAARDRVGDFPILIKMNGTDEVPDGIDVATLKTQAAILAEAGFDALEVSGAMRDTLAVPESVLGFRPVPAPESRVGIMARERQSYYLSHAQAVRKAVDVPVILVGGNRDVERIEEIVSSGWADFVAMCRPLIREPNLVSRWRSGKGSSEAACIACNACIYDMHTSRRPGRVRCVALEQPGRLADAIRWRDEWVGANVAPRAEWEKRP